LSSDKQPQRQQKPKPSQAIQQPKKGAAERVVMRNKWYVDSFRMIIIAFAISLTLNVLQGLVIGYQVANPVAPKYFATTTDGRIIPIVALDQPNMSSSSIAQWATKAIVESYSFDYSRYKDELNKAGQTFFTPKGFKAYVAAIKGSGVLDTVISKRLIVKTIITSAPSIEAEGLVNGVYTWKMTVPVTIDYQGATMNSKRQNVVHITVRRVSETSSDRGLAVSEFIVE